MGYNGHAIAFSNKYERKNKEEIKNGQRKAFEKGITFRWK